MESLAADVLQEPLGEAHRPFSAAPERIPTDLSSDSSCLLDLLPGTVGRRLSALEWDFHDTRSDELTHDLHPYPAKFVSHLARQAITALSRPGDLVLDPFSGGGTTAVEAVSAGRNFIGIDANPVGNAIAAAKTTPLASTDLRALMRLEADVLGMQGAEFERCESPWLPDIPNRAKWYSDDVFHALGVIRACVMRLQLASARKLALLAFIQAATRLSFQDSETRYKSTPRPVSMRDVTRSVAAELRRMRQVAERCALLSQCTPRFIEGDARKSSSYDLAPGSAGLVLTSPPYPNAYDYHLYHRFRIFWLGREPRHLRSIEIGSHLRNQSLRDPVGHYVEDLRQVLSHCYTALAQGRWAVFVVGDGLFDGQIFDTADQLRATAQSIGFEHVTTINRTLPAHRRSVTHPGRRLTMEQIVVLKRPLRQRAVTVLDPNYRLLPYEREIQVRELDALGSSPAVVGDRVTIATTGAHARAAFSHGVALADGQRMPNAQSHIEGAHAPSSRRKHSTYATHGIHRYKGKFYPQLAKSLLNMSGLAPEMSLVADPFGGSGTLAVEAVLNGFQALSIDRNPVAVAIARAKLVAIKADRKRLGAQAAHVRAAIVDATSSGSRTLTQFSPSCLAEIERWFPSTVLHKLDHVLRTLRHADADLVGFFEVLASDIVREISQQEPRDLRIRRRAVPITDAPVYELYIDRLDAAMRNLTAFWRVLPDLGPFGSGTAVLGDSATEDAFGSLRGRKLDAVVSSPPYAAALPYVDTDRLSLAAIFGISSQDRKTIEQAMIGSREISERERAAYDRGVDELTDAQLPPSTRTFLADYRAAIEADRQAGFRRRQAPAVLSRYFQAMSTVLDQVHTHMAPGAPCWLVLGDSRSTIGGRRWTIPTVDEVAAIAAHQGFRLIDRIPITVTRENVIHARHAITRNEILQLRA